MLLQTSFSCPFVTYVFFPQSSKKDNASEGAEDTCSSEKADAAGSSDEDEGALVIDEKNERGGNKRKAEESTEVRLLRPDLRTFLENLPIQLLRGGSGAL